MQKERVKS